MWYATGYRTAVTISCRVLIFGCRGTRSFCWFCFLLTGVVVFAVIFCMATLLFVPGLILTIGAGVAFGRALGFGWGLLFGSIAVIIGAMAACIIAFYLQ